jgi:hypothetical protein
MRGKEGPIQSNRSLSGSFPPQNNGPVASAKSRECEADASEGATHTRASETGAGASAAPEHG